MTQAHAIRFHQTGGPEVLRWEALDVGAPAPGEAQVRHTAVGLNFIDTYHRSGLYPVPLPSGLGLEAAGVVEAVGAGVKVVQPGDRVAYNSGGVGAYSEVRLIAAERLVKLPKSVSDEAAAASMLAGMTAWYLLCKTFPVQRGQTILWHAAAGGVGQIAVQWARALGVRVIGTVGSDEKADIARNLGCEEVIVYTREKVSTRVRELTDGQGVPVVYDGVGQSTFMDSLDCLAQRGLMVSFGSASGAVAPFDISALTSKGGLYLTRPSLVNYTTTRAELLEGAEALFQKLSSQQVSLQIGQRYALRDAAQAHRELEARQTIGSSVLLP